VPRDPFQYAVIRVVPRVDRGEFLNVGVILFCRTRGYLEARIELDAARLTMLAPHADLEGLVDQFDALVGVAAGASDAGPIARLSQSERFHWLVAPSSTVVQTSPVHSGLCEDPAATLDHLVQSLVLVPAS
jgi:Protein of unknown function (DUF3037)